MARRLGRFAGETSPGVVSSILSQSKFQAILLLSGKLGKAIANQSQKNGNSTEMSSQPQLHSPSQNLISDRSGVDLQQ
jgi:hypothetical protein